MAITTKKQLLYILNVYLILFSKRFRKDMSQIIHVQNCALKLHVVGYF